jgi:diguanylate cyclase (GGDEF)-like protein
MARVRRRSRAPWRADMGAGARAGTRCRMQMRPRRRCVHARAVTNPLPPDMRPLRRRLRRHLAPLAGDTVGTANMPPVRVSLLTKFNLLTVGLIFLATSAITTVLFWRQWTDEERQLRIHGETIALMLADLSEYGLRTSDRTSLGQILDSLPGDTDIAYLVVLDADRRTLSERFMSAGFDAASVPPLAPHEQPAPGAGTRRIERALAPGRALEIIAPVAGITAALRPRASTVGAPAEQAATHVPAPLGFVRVGLTFDQQRQRLVAQLLGAATVVGVLLVIAVSGTLLLTRGLVSPMRRLMRAARAVGGGRLDVFVPVRSADELGLLTHAFNQMTSRLAQSQGEVAHYQRTLEDKVTQRTRELEVATAHAYKLAQHDILTGLPNRSLLNARLKQILAQAQRDQTHVACLFLDFDHFKRINDTLGHDAGDQLLQAIGQRLSDAVREMDTVARLGGDEFVVVLPGLDPANASFEVTTVIQRIRDAFLAPFRLSDQSPTLTCSIGVAVHPVDAADGVTLIKQADTAMYAAKEAGRNAYRFYTADMNARVQQRLQIETDMRRALMDDEFFLVYQPQIDVRTGRPCGVEALLRWRDPERGIIGPSEFIPIAEESGMIQALGARVLREACRQVMQWHRQDMLPRLSVNLSVQQLQHESWLAIVDEALRNSGLAPHYLDLEITESAIITYPEKAVETLLHLKQMGVSITVDDFGTGYSSLSYLARLPIQGIKIDRRFVAGLHRNANDEAITHAIVALSDSLGLRCIAEGVETEAQLEFLRRLGCEEAQGFLFTRPLEHEALRAWWRARENSQAQDTRQPDLWRTA